jgi:hypothetical protein
MNDKEQLEQAAERIALHTFPKPPSHSVYPDWLNQHRELLRDSIMADPYLQSLLPTEQLTGETPGKVERYWNKLPDLMTSQGIVKASDYDALQHELNAAKEEQTKTRKALMDSLEQDGV